MDNLINEGKELAAVKKTPMATEGGVWVTDFTEESAKVFVEEVKKFTEKAPKDKPLMVFIDSYGGYVDSLATMIAALDEVKSQVVTICMGKAMSCGAMLLSHGDLRFATKHSRIMIHETSSASWGNVKDIVVSTEEIVRLNNYWMKIIASNCGYSVREWSKLFKNDKRDIYLDATQAKRFGVIDEIGIPKVKTESKVTYKLVY